MEDLKKCEVCGRNMDVKAMKLANGKYFCSEGHKEEYLADISF